VRIGASTNVRGRALAAYISDDALDRLNELAYGLTPAYLPGAPGFRAYLFPWEEAAIERFFPRPPARILLGGAGGGREALWLADMGFDVVAFDPAIPLVKGLARATPAGGRLDVYRAGYEELPLLAPALSGAPGIDLRDLAHFDAAILGWGSFSHIRTREGRVHALSRMAEVTRGPILLSLLALKNEAASDGRNRPKRLRPRRRSGREPADLVSLNIGFYHPMSEEEVRSLAESANLKIRFANFDTRDTNWPHAVLETPAKSS
jgi:hypothetical protein